ncbi:hypothetical protein KC332_g85 [Hortaea werneckii]|nr:hypothetical protein KC332_g85 [Hortaea werneckii]
MTERQACLDQHETMQLLVHVNLSLCNLFLTHAADPTPTTAGGVYHSIRRMPLISRETAQQLTIRIKKSKRKSPMYIIVFRLSSPKNSIRSKNKPLDLRSEAGPEEGKLKSGCRRRTLGVSKPARCRPLPGRLHR